MSTAAEWAPGLFKRIAVPRMAGSKSLADVEAAIAERLSAMGYRVAREPFVTSDRSLAAVALAGAGFGWTALLIMPLFLLAMPGWPLFLVGTGAMALVALLTVGVQRGLIGPARPGVTTANIVATRGEPVLWLVAHWDSKGQALSLAHRVVAVVALGIGAVWLLTALTVRLVVVVPWWVVAPGALLAAVGGAALSRAKTSNVSPGAVDNASGVIAALAAAERLRERADVGVLITGAEEYGMAGARAWIAGSPRGNMFLNFDGVDSRGAVRITTHARGALRGRSGGSLNVRGVVRDHLVAQGHDVSQWGLPAGIPVDGVVLASNGMDGVTVSRGDWTTARLVHTACDVPDRLDVGAILTVGLAAAEAATRLVDAAQL